MQPGDPADPNSYDDTGDNSGRWLSEFSREDADRDNPYRSFGTVALDPPVVLAPHSPRPRWWTPLAVAGVSLGVFIVASAIMTVVAMAVVIGKVDTDTLRDAASFRAISESRIGLFIMVVVPQIFLAVPAILAGILSPVETRERLSLTIGRWPIWAWLAAAAATPLVGLISSVVVGAFMEESENLKSMSEIFRDHGNSGFLIPLIIMIGATPALCEEILFRGYVQTRLNRAFGPLIGVSVASLLFAAFHLDPVHVIAVLPLGIFLGIVTWQSESLFPAMLGHFVNNAISVAAVVVAPVGNADTLELPAAIFSISIILCGIMGAAGVLAAYLWYGSPANPRMLSGNGPPATPAESPLIDSAGASSTSVEQ